MIAFRNERRKQPRREETEEAPTLPARLPVTNATPAATELFALRNFHSFLRGKGYSNTIHSLGSMVDIPEYTEKDREAFLAGFQSEVNLRFSKRQTNNIEEDMNGCDIRLCSDDDGYDLVECGAAGQPQFDLSDQLRGCRIASEYTIRLRSANDLV